MLLQLISSSTAGGRTVDLQTALAPAIRSPGWNNRPRDVRQYKIGDCVLYVVPYRRWAWHRRERELARTQLDIAN